jgi:hypothetical protein
MTAAAKSRGIGHELEGARGRYEVLHNDDFDAADLRAVAASNTDQLVLVVPGGQLDHGDGQLEGLADVVLQVPPGPATSRRSRGELPVGSRPVR